MENTHLCSPKRNTASTPWWPLSELLNSLAQKVEILLSIDILWSGDGELSLMLASNNQQSVKESRKSLWAAVDDGILL